MDLDVIGEKGNKTMLLFPRVSWCHQETKGAELDEQTSVVSLKMYKQCCVSEGTLHSDSSASPNYLEFFNHSAVYFSDKVLGNSQLGYTELVYSVQHVINTLVEGGYG